MRARTVSPMATRARRGSFLCALAASPFRHPLSDAPAFAPRSLMPASPGIPQEQGRVRVREEGGPRRACRRLAREPRMTVTPSPAPALPAPCRHAAAGTVEGRPQRACVLGLGGRRARSRDDRGPRRLAGGFRSHIPERTSEGPVRAVPGYYGHTVLYTLHPMYVCPRSHAPRAALAGSRCRGRSDNNTRVRLSAPARVCVPAPAASHAGVLLFPVHSQLPARALMPRGCSHPARLNFPSVGPAGRWAPRRGRGAWWGQHRDMSTVEMARESIKGRARAGLRTALRAGG